LTDEGWQVAARDAVRVVHRHDTGEMARQVQPVHIAVERFTRGPGGLDHAGAALQHIDVALQARLDHELGVAREVIEAFAVVRLDPARGHPEKQTADRCREHRSGKQGRYGLFFVHKSPVFLTTRSQL
jgi:hypothetical protein